MATPPMQLIDLVCFSHLRWNFVFQRPQHLMTRHAARRRVLFFEEPQFHQGGPALDLSQDGDGPIVAVPKLPLGLTEAEVATAQQRLLDDGLASLGIERFLSWYYTPMALKFSRHLRPVATVYDCMDQLSHFKGAPQDMTILEQELLATADVVFTGGQSLYEAKRGMHPNVHAFPSSVDVAHFAKARAAGAQPEDQHLIPRPRLGYVGVIDERIDLDLIAQVATMRPAWQIVMVGPVVKISCTTLPTQANIHYLGSKPYDQLPAYLAGWDVGVLPFARNEATRYISPTKTPEYLAAGRRVVSTSIRDVQRPYGDLGLVGIADDPAHFVSLVEAALADQAGRPAWLAAVDRHLAKLSWNRTFDGMAELIDRAVVARRARTSARRGSVPVRGGRAADAQAASQV